MNLPLLIALGLWKREGAALCASTGIDVVLHGERVTSGEYAGQERVSLIKMRKGRRIQSITLTYRYDQAIPDRIHTLGDYVAAEINIAAFARAVFVIKVTARDVILMTPFKDKKAMHFVGSDVTRIGGCLVGCQWVSPDLIPSSWGSYMFVVTGKKVTWGRLPSREEGFEAAAGEEPGTFKLSFWDSNTGWSFLDTYQWPPKCKGSEWQLVRAF